MTFEDFAELCRSNGLVAKDYGNFHWQINGGVCRVNFYPASKRGLIYVNGATAKTSYPGNPEMAVAAALGKGKILEPGRAKTKRMLTTKSKRIRVKWWKQGRRCCHWCPKEFKAFEEMTLDHVIPLFRGGSNFQDNLVPACGPCNKRRGHELTRKEETQ